jgi:hypothetical protein
MFFFPILDNTITQKKRFSNDSWPFQALSSAAQASNFGISPMDKLCTRCASVMAGASLVAWIPRMGQNIPGNHGIW